MHGSEVPSSCFLSFEFKTETTTQREKWQDYYVHRGESPGRGGCGVSNIPQGAFPGTSRIDSRDDERIAKQVVDGGEGYLEQGVNSRTTVRTERIQTQ